MRFNSSARRAKRQFLPSIVDRRPTTPSTRTHKHPQNETAPSNATPYPHTSSCRSPIASITAVRRFGTACASCSSALAPASAIDACSSGGRLLLLPSPLCIITCACKTTITDRRHIQQHPMHVRQPIIEIQPPSIIHAYGPADAPSAILLLELPRVLLADDEEHAPDDVPDHQLQRLRLHQRLKGWTGRRRSMGLIMGRVMVVVS